VTRICWWLVNVVSRVLEPAERDAVGGDLAESGETGVQALREVLGLAVRRQGALWCHWRPWLILAFLAAPLGMRLNLFSRRVADHSAIYAWMYLNNWDWAYLGRRAFWTILAQTIPSVFLDNLALICLSWTSGFVLGALSRRTIPFNGALFCFVLLFGNFVALPQGTLGRHFNNNAAVFSRTFYSAMLPVLVQMVMVVIPSLWGMFEGLRMATFPPLLRTILGAPAIVTMAVLAANQGVWLAAMATHNFTLLQSGWQLPLLPFAVAGPVVYLLANSTWKRWHLAKPHHR
jgi:hypothetical protein